MTVAIITIDDATTTFATSDINKQTAKLSRVVIGILIAGSLICSVRIAVAATSTHTGKKAMTNRSNDPPTSGFLIPNTAMCHIERGPTIKC